mmetsp:Transcript_43954/g.102777  ORF Transcript_43954/g.102777 Transcript_43954/m.102777 type:complete len:139 (-) Transcript_43954:513-929(-)
MAAAGGCTRWHSMQYGVALNMVATALEAIRALAREEPRLLGREVELKIVGGASHATVGAHGHGALACLNVHWRLSSDEIVLLDALEAAMQALGAVPHLGKRHCLPPGYAERALPGLIELRALARQLDPDGLFAMEAIR